MAKVKERSVVVCDKNGVETVVLKHIDPLPDLCQQVEQGLDDGQRVKIISQASRTKPIVWGASVFVGLLVVTKLAFVGTSNENNNDGVSTSVNASHWSIATSLDAKSTITTLDFHDERKLLLVGTEKGTVIVYDVASGTATQLPHASRIQHVSWSHEGDQFLTIADGHVAVWDTASMEPTSWLGGHVNNGRGMSLAHFGHSGDRAAFVFSDRVNVFDFLHMDDLCSFQLADNHRVLKFIAFSPDDSALVTATRSRVACIDSVTGRPRWKSDSEVSGLSTNDDGSLISWYGRDGFSVYHWKDDPVNVAVIGVRELRFQGTSHAIIETHQSLRRWDFAKSEWCLATVPLPATYHGFGLLENRRIALISENGVSIWDPELSEVQTHVALNERELHSEIASFASEDLIFAVGHSEIEIWQYSPEDSTRLMQAN